jgi:hypothetical protein
MQRHSRVFALLALVAATFSLAGCPRGTTISEINADPGRYRNNEVAIEGRVVNSFGVAGEGAYELDDGTGRIWVVSSGGGVPSQGARVRAVGRVQSGITFAGRSFANVIRETQRHSQSPR